MRSRSDDLLLGEWACLGVLAAGPTHGFAISKRLAPAGDVGRVWSLSRALTYRALDQLVVRGLARAVAREPGVAGGTRTILAVTRTGRARLHRWLDEPVVHLRDLRSELLLKLVVSDVCDVDPTALLERQLTVVSDLVTALAVSDTLQVDALLERREPRLDLVAMWRMESSQAALRFVERALAAHHRAEPAAT
jgi:DNA-binding PadR family transcriptional regulator